METLEPVKSNAPWSYTLAEWYNALPKSVRYDFDYQTIQERMNEILPEEMRISYNGLLGWKDRPLYLRSRVHIEALQYVTLREVPAYLDFLEDQPGDYSPLLEIDKSNLELTKALNLK